MASLKTILKQNKLDGDPAKALREVVSRGELALLKELAAAGVRLADVANRLISAAARAGQVEMFAYLANEGASIRALDNRNEPAFQALLDETKSVAALQVLLAHGYDPNEEGKWGYLSLRSAIRAEEKSLFDALIAAGARPDGREGKEGAPLTWCTSATTLGWLLAAGADPVLAVLNGVSLLHKWTAEDDAEAILEILKAGAPFTKNAAGWTPMMLASDRANPRPKALAAFEAAGHALSSAVDSRLPAAILAKDEETTEALLAEGHVDVVDADNTSALVHALIAREPELAARLLDAGADAAHVDRRERCALGESLFDEGIFSRLIANEPNDACLAAATKAACQTHDATALRRLLNAGAVADAKSLVRVCAGASRYNANKVAAGVCFQVLIDAGVDPKGVEVDGEAILEHLRRKRFMDMVATLESVLDSPVDYGVGGTLDAKGMRAFWNELGHPNIDWVAAAKKVRRPQLSYLVAERDVDALRCLLEAGLPASGLWQAASGAARSTRVMSFLIEHIPRDAVALSAALSDVLRLTGTPASPRQHELVSRLLALGAKADGSAPPFLGERSKTLTAKTLDALLAAGAKVDARDLVQASHALRGDLVPLYLAAMDVDLDADVTVPNLGLASVREHLLTIKKQKSAGSKRRANEILTLIGL